MKKYIERYIYDVTRRLPKDIQSDIEKELNSNIYDMLPENPTEEDIDNVLHNLGHPRVIANGYKENKNYVISPTYYDDYIRILKVVAIIVGVITVFFASIDIITNINEPSILDSILYIFSRLIGDTISSLVFVFFIVTVIFWIIDKENVKNKKDDWKIKELPDLPSPTSTKISRTSGMVGLIFYSIFSVIFIVILLEYIPVIGWYENDTLVAKIFNQTITDKFIIPFIISAILGFVVHITKIYEGEWKLNVAIYYTVSSVFSVTIGLIFINFPGLLNNQFITKIATQLDINVIEVNDAISTGLTVITVIIIILTFIDLISIWYKTLKPKKVLFK
ncbi:MAG: hypothetical protein PF513_01125 [Tenericutes bacterium]|jgi:hypothetical protein|nr:hypothetical protein [Mycoplasmatota bacterium]